MESGVEKKNIRVQPAECTMCVCNDTVCAAVSCTYKVPLY